MTRPCLICDRPRDGDRLWCGADACLQHLKLMPVAELNAIREREILEAWRANPGGAAIVHMTPRE